MTRFLWKVVRRREFWFLCLANFTIFLMYGWQKQLRNSIFQLANLV